MRQIARNVTMEGCGALRDCRYLLHDRDAKYTQSASSLRIRAADIDQRRAGIASNAIDPHCGRLRLMI
jgi:hypothetical protein